MVGVDVFSIYISKLTGFSNCFSKRTNFSSWWKKKTKNWQTAFSVFFFIKGRLQFFAFISIRQNFSYSQQTSFAPYSYSLLIPAFIRLSYICIMAISTSIISFANAERGRTHLLVYIWQDRHKSFHTKCMSRTWNSWIEFGSA